MTTAVRPRYQFDRLDRRTRRVSSGLITAICQRIVEHMQPEKVILFGSRASGLPRPDSDLDLMVILSSNHPLAKLTRRDRSLKVLDLFRYRLFSLDVIVVTESEVSEIRSHNEGEWNLVLDVLSRGSVLYERA